LLAPTKGLHKSVCYVINMEKFAANASGKGRGATDITKEKSVRGKRKHAETISSPIDNNDHDIERDNLESNAISPNNSPNLSPVQSPTPSSSPLTTKRKR